MLSIYKYYKFKALNYVMDKVIYKCYNSGDSDKHLAVNFIRSIAIKAISPFLLGLYSPPYS